MSVYTNLSNEDIATILESYELGTLHAHEGIAAGIENSNFFIETDNGQYVLTLFERMQAEELPYFMHLMRHLSDKGIPCPNVMKRDDGNFLFEVEGKRGCIISRLPGRTVERLNEAQLIDAGSTLALIHLAGNDFGEHRTNPTGRAWLHSRIEEMNGAVAARFGEEAAHLLKDEFSWQQLHEHDLPAGVIHADYFCDNILFEANTVSGVIDFYYACNDAYAMDIAIALNALAVSIKPVETDLLRIKAFLDGYSSVRTMQASEIGAIPDLLRLAALRFWVSRLFDALFPREGAITQVKDPEEYRAKLLFHRGIDQAN